MSMKFPTRGTNARDAIDTIAQHGPLSFEGACAIHGFFRLGQERVAKFYQRLVSDGWLLFFEDKYSLSSITMGELKKEKGDAPKNIAGIREARPFKRWTGLYDIDPRGPRRFDELEKI